MTNILVTSMLLLGGAAVMNSLTGMNIYAVRHPSLPLICPLWLTSLAVANGGKDPLGICHCVHAQTSCDAS